MSLNTMLPLSTWRQHNNVGGYQSKQCLAPSVHTLFIALSPPSPIYSLFESFCKFFSAQGWKVYDCHHHPRIPLLQAMQETCEDIDPCSWQVQIQHSRQYFQRHSISFSLLAQMFFFMFRIQMVNELCLYSTFSNLIDHLEHFTLLPPSPIHTELFHTESAFYTHSCTFTDQWYISGNLGLIIMLKDTLSFATSWTGRDNLLYSNRR